jgi:hypothetical protein
VSNAEMTMKYDRIGLEAVVRVARENRGRVSPNLKRR